MTETQHEDKRELPAVASVAARQFLRDLDPIGRHGLVAMHPRSDVELDLWARKIVTGGREPTTDTEREKIVKRRASLPKMRLEGISYRGDEKGRHASATTGHFRAERFVETNSRSNQYYHVNEPAEDAYDLTKCSDDDIGNIRSCFLDFDVNKDLIDPAKLDTATVAANWTAERERIRGIAERLQASATPPTSIVDSGGGVQALWQLVENVAATDETRAIFDQIEANLLAAHPDADQAVCDLSRILRLPGSVNVKRKGYERTAMVAGKAGPKYTFDQLLAAWPTVPMPTKARASRGAGKASRAEELALIATIEPEMPTGLLGRLASETGMLGRLWREGADAVPGDNHSGSQCRWELCRQMMRAGFSFSDCWHTALAWDASDGANAWGERALARAWLDVASREANIAAALGFEPVDESEDVGDTGMIDLEQMLARAFDPAPAEDLQPGVATAGTTAKFERRSVQWQPTRTGIAVEEVARALTPVLPGRGDNLVAMNGTLLTAGTFDVPVLDANGALVIKQQRGLVPVDECRLRHIIEERVDLWRYETRGAKGDGGSEPEPRPVPVPEMLVRDLMSTQVVGGLGFEPVVGSTEGPLIRLDGSIRASAGYDPQSATWVLNNHILATVPEAPTRDDAMASLRALEGLLNEFPWGGETAAERDLNRAVALCALLTATLRSQLPTAPGVVIDAPVPGSGKSELSKLSGAFAYAGNLPLMAATPDPAEFRKRIEGAVLASPTVIVVDNLTGQLDGDAINMLLTSETATIRPLGTSDGRIVSTRFLLLVNGNQLKVRDDLCRRLVACRLDPRCERPEQRRFSGNPVATVRADRAAWLRHVAIILRAFRASGEAQAGGGLAGFETWYDACVRPLLWLGLPDPVRSQDALREGDDGIGQSVALLSGLRDYFGGSWFTTGDVVTLLDAHGGLCPRFGVAANDDEAMAAEGDLVDVGHVQQVLSGFVDRRRGSPLLSLGRVLGKHTDRHFGGLVLRRSQGKMKGQWCWRIMAPAESEVRAA